MSLEQLLALAAAGLVAGWMNVMAGGGSMLSVPMLLFLGLSGPVANGSNRIAILAQNTVAAFTFFKRGYSDFKLSLSLAAMAIPGAIIGARIGAELDGVWFNRVLAITMLVVLISMFLPAKKKIDDAAVSSQPKNRTSGHILMIFAGLWGGFIQIGVGFILMPILHKVLGLDLVRVNMHKVFIVLCYTIFALLVFSHYSGVDWRAGLTLAVGMAAGGWLGARTTLKIDERWIKGIFAIILLVFVGRLIFF